MHAPVMRRSSWVLSVLASAAGLLVSSFALAQEELEAELPEITYPPPGARVAVTLAGLSTTALSYGAALGMSFIYPDSPGAHDLRVPVVGPWIALAHNGCASGEPDCNDLVVILRAVLTAIDGVVQAGGLAIAVEGLLMPTQQPPPPSPPRPPAERPTGPMRVRPKAPPPAAPPGAPKDLFLLPTPMTVGMRGVGVGIVGRF